MMNDVGTYRRHSQWLTQISIEYRLDAHKPENHRTKQSWLKRADEFESEAENVSRQADSLEGAYKRMKGE